MRFAGTIKNDFAAAPGACLSFFVQGCPIKCPGCHNPDNQDFHGGQEFTPEVLQSIIKDLNANGIKRKFCVMGGEPLCPENKDTTLYIIQQVKQYSPSTPVYVWTGYIYEDLLAQNDTCLNSIFNLIDTLIDGPFIEEEKDLTLQMRGSRNQRIIDF